MKEEVAYVVSAFALILGIGLLAFGVGDITGYSLKEISSTSVEVSPKIVSPGEYIGISVSSLSKRGVGNRFSICKDNRLCVSSGWLHCTGYGCRGTIDVEYRVPSNLIAGKYHVKVRDMSNGEDVKGYFDVE